MDLSEVLERHGPRAGGWRTCHVRHRGGAFALRSSMLPSDEAFFEICDHLRTLTNDASDD